MIAGIRASLNRDFPELANGSEVSAHVSEPRAYMGRLDAGKVHWTIDLRESMTDSRTRQVRVKVDEQTGTFAYPKEKVDAHLQALKAIVAEAKSKRDLFLAARAKIPTDKPEWLLVRVLKTGGYSVEANGVQESTMLQIVDLLKGLTR